MGMEANGFFGVTKELLSRLSAGTRLVSHFRNVNAVDRLVSHCTVHNSRTTPPTS